MSNEKSFCHVPVTLRISGSALVLFSLCAFIFGIRVLLPLALACAVHELGHIVALLLQNCIPESLVIDASGLLIRYRGGQGGLRGFVRAFSGPLAGLLLAALLLHSPSEMLSACSKLSLALSFGNLLPFSTLDGGSMLRFLWEMVSGKMPPGRLIFLTDALTAASVLLCGCIFNPQLLLYGLWLLIGLLRNMRCD